MSIDDLFSQAEAQRAALKPATPVAVRAISLIAVAVIFTGLAWVLLRLSGLDSPLPLLFAVMFTLTGMVRLTKWLKPGSGPRQIARTEESELVPDGLKLAVNRWDVMLDWCHTDVARFNRRVLPRLGELVDEKLRQKFGFTRASEPHKARLALGDPLWTSTTMPHRRVPHPKELDQIITALEKL